MDVFVSHPFAALLSQFALGATHANAHEPPSQNAVPLVGVLHAVGQRPQWLTLVALLTSQPSTELPLQSTNPMLQENEQVEFTHVSVAFGSAPEHEVPHEPQ